MDRRQFLHSTASSVIASFYPGATETEVTLTLAQPDKAWPAMPEDFVGLSYESGQLYDPDFFSPENVPLVEAFRQLNDRGVLRLGGHLSNITAWQGVGLDDEKQMRGVRHGIEDYWEWPLVDARVQQNKHGRITRQAIGNLRGFLDALDWRLLYGLNFACGSTARAADEAEAVAGILGDRLIAFVVGNEVDGFKDDPYFRARDYGFSQYIAEYERWVKAIRAKVPRAAFAGPDTDGKVDTWVLEYARQTRGDAILLTSHYYGMGPASDPRMTAEVLLRRADPELDAQIAAVSAARAAAGGTPYRMDEGNSCFGGGKKGVSDAYASALWAADYLLKAACAGFAGVNMHGGGVGVYTPIESSSEAPASRRPVYYGMQFAQQFAGCDIAPCALRTSANITAYAGHKAGTMLLAFVNKGESAQTLKLPGSLKAERFGSRWELRGPALDSRNGVQFGPATVDKHGPAIEVAGYSAVILRSP